LLVFSVTDQQSFKEVDSFVKQIYRIKEKKKFPIVILANKTDLEYRVSEKDFKEYCNNEEIPLLETSALLKKNIKESFELIVRETMKFYNNDTSDDKKKKKKDCIVS
jgi:GTPase SAR1 family protein